MSTRDFQTLLRKVMRILPVSCDTTGNTSWRTEVYRANAFGEDGPQPFQLLNSLVSATNMLLLCVRHNWAKSSLFALADSAESLCRRYFSGHRKQTGWACGKLYRRRATATGGNTPLGCRYYILGLRSLSFQIVVGGVSWFVFRNVTEYQLGSYTKYTYRPPYLNFAVYVDSMRNYMLPHRFAICSYTRPLASARLLIDVHFCIPANCPGTSGTVPDLLLLPLVPHGRPWMSRKIWSPTA